MSSNSCVKKVLAVASLATSVAGHGAIISPRSRNSVDYLVNVNTPKDWPSNGDCTNITGGDCHNGQAPFWYSQGCFIGCPECDHMSGRVQTDLCGLGFKATINDPKHRTVNRNATAGSAEDIYKHNPWRAPGYAPTADACGLAGGTPWPQEVAEAGDYTTTKFAHHGMNGTALKPLDTGVVWKAGSEVEVSWQISNHHGGGYAYRLCPAEVGNETLTEECFQAHHLDFVEDGQAIVFPNGTLFPVEGTFIRDGTFPVGSQWAMIPMPTTALGPRCIPGPNDTDTTPNKCLPGEDKLMDGPCVPCPQTPGSDCSRCDNNWDGATSFAPPCDGCEGSTHQRAIRDLIKIPADLTPGKWVLGLRYDCEATAQVWNSCSDVTIEA